MADTPRQPDQADDLPDGEAVADATPGQEAGSPEPVAESPADTEPAAAETVEPSAAPKDELMPGGPQAWRRDSGLLLAQADPYVGGHWSVPWSDLMMVMFVLFAVLVAVQMRENRELVESAERKQPVPLSVPKPVPTPTPTPTPVPSFEPLMRVNVFERSQDAVREARVENVEIVLLDDRSVKVSVQGPMFFELGEATLRPEVREFLDRLARVIGQTSYAVRVIGHTDDYPVDTEVFPSNWELSAARAARVARYLINSADIDPWRFTVMGRGEYEPAVPNTSDANRALNRRVEIIITRDKVEQGTPPESGRESEADPDSGAETGTETGTRTETGAASDAAPNLQGSESTDARLPDNQASMNNQSARDLTGEQLPQAGGRASEMQTLIEAPTSNAEMPIRERLEAERANTETSPEQILLDRQILEQAEPGEPIPMRGLSRMSSPSELPSSESLGTEGARSEVPAPRTPDVNNLDAVMPNDAAMPNMETRP